MTRVCCRLLLAPIALLIALSPALAQSRQVRIIQTNSGDDSIHLIDPATNAIVGEIRGVPINHGAAAAPDGSRLYFSSEAERVLAVVDGKTRQVTMKIALNGIPRTALAPLFIVWLGIGLWSKVGVVFLLTFFLNFFNTYTGMRQMDQEYVDLARLMGVKGWKLSVKVIFPAISPYVFTGIRTSIPFAVIGAIVGEFVAATEGVGFFIRMSAGIFKTADVFVGIIVLMIMVIIMDRIAEMVERRALRWQSQTEHIQIQA